MFLKKRKAKKSNRGIYIQDLQLKDTVFQAGTKYKYIIDSKQNQLVILPSDEGNTVSKRKIEAGINPVIDIRKREALETFSKATSLEIEIFEDKIIVRGFTSSSDETNTQQASFEVAISKEQLQQYTDKSVIHFLSGPRSKFSQTNLLEIPLKIASLFSGAGILDQGFIEKGFDIVFAIEKDSEAVETYRHNIGNHILCEDITKFDFQQIGQTQAPILIGGSPCQGFSNSNRYTNFLANPNNLLVNYYIEAVKKNPYCKVFVLENVPQLLTAGGGKFKEEICAELSDFEITSGVVNDASVGGFQTRERTIMIGSKIGRIELPNPTHSKGMFRTVREAFRGLHDLIPNQLDFSKPAQLTIERMKHVPQGSNWQSIPDYLKTTGMLKGKSHSYVYRRLEWDKPSITLTNVRKSLITHPEEHRTLTVRECARLFGIQDNFVFKGKLNSMQQQIANAVPIAISRSVAQAVKKAIQQFNQSLTKDIVPTA